MLAARIFYVEHNSWKEPVKRLHNVGHSSVAIIWRDSLHRFESGMDGFDAAIQGRTREINSEFAHQGPCSETDEYEQKKNREYAEKAIYKEQPIAEAPQEIPLGKTKAAEGHDGAKWDEDEDVDGEEPGVSGEIKEKRENESDEEADADFAEGLRNLTNSRHYL
jgi:hypothetical protein